MLIAFFYFASFSKNSWNNTLYLDEIIWQYISKIRNVEITPEIIIVTRLADSWFLFIVVTAVTAYLVLKLKKYIVAIWLCLSIIFGALLLNYFLKNYYDRPRPFEINQIENLAHASGYSFPSGHSMGSIITYLLITYLLTKKINNNFWRYLVYIMAIFLCLLIAFTRVYLGVHYPTDVMAGFSIGLSWALGCIILYRFIINKGENN